MLRNNQLQRSFNNRANSYEQHADAPAAVNAGATQLASMSGNPGFAAQFDVQFILKYFTAVPATGVYTVSTAAAVAAAVPALATQGAAFLYGNSDFAAGFKRLQQAFPLTGGWLYGTPGIYGKDVFQIPGFTAGLLGFFTPTVEAVLVKGDLVQPIYVTSGGVVYVMLSIIRCSQVGYGTLLDALNSDKFIQNMIRYIQSDTTAVGLAQYNNNIFIMKQSLFGKFDSDFVSPNSFKMPEQFQTGIIDVPLKTGVDKQRALGMYINYDVVLSQWSIFIQYVDKNQF